MFSPLYLLIKLVTTLFLEYTIQHYCFCKLSTYLHYVIMHFTYTDYQWSAMNTYLTLKNEMVSKICLEKEIITVLWFMLLNQGFYCQTKQEENFFFHMNKNLNMNWRLYILHNSNYAQNLWMVRSKFYEINHINHLQVRKVL